MNLDEKFKEMAEGLDDDITVIERSVQETLTGTAEPLSAISDNAYYRAIGVGIGRAIKEAGINDADDLFDHISKHCPLGFIVLDPTPESRAAYMSRLVRKVAESALTELASPPTITDRTLSFITNNTKQYAYGFLEDSLLNVQ